MRTLSFSIVAAVFLLIAAGCARNPVPPDEESSYPDCTVSGQVLDLLDDTPLANVWVLVWNGWDTEGAATDSNGNFSMTVDGSDASSYVRVSSPQATYTQVRTREWTTSITGTVNLGVLKVYTSDVILFTTRGNMQGSDLWAIRDDGTGLKLIVHDPDSMLMHPRWGRGSDRSRIAYVDRQLDEVWACNLDGTGASRLAQVPAAYSTYYIEQFDWAERGVALTLYDGNTHALYIDATNKWDSLFYGDFSPPDFSAWGGLIGGANLLLGTGHIGSGSSGIWFANPYGAAHTNLVNDSTSGSDVYVKWSPLMGTGGDVLYILWVNGSNQIECALMSDIGSTSPDVEFGTPWILFNTVSVKQAAWSPDGQYIVAVASPWGNLYKIPFSTSTTSTYSAFYTGSNASAALWVEWQ